MGLDELTAPTSAPKNPFEITKAVDFTDAEINGTWVDWPAPGGFATWFDIASPMARIIRGGKGTGRTHVMRQFSAAVQAIRGAEDPIAQVVANGVLGIYVVCSGLNSSRFRGKALSEEAWQSVFSQYADLWLAQSALAAFVTITERCPPSREVQSSIAQEVRMLLSDDQVGECTTLSDLRGTLFAVQKRIDLAINNAALYPDEPLNVIIASTASTLVFGVPEAIRNHYKPFRDVTFLYLIDEFENFERPQQEYVNSLVREKQVGTSFMIGVRTYGLKTLRTVNQGEINREGSEFEEILPERYYTGKNRGRYREFCRNVVALRLANAQLIDAGTTTQNLKKQLEQLFELPLANLAETSIRERYVALERPYLVRLRRDLVSHAASIRIRSSDVDPIVESARIASRPLLEKVNAFLIYRGWARGVNLVELARQLIDERPTPDSDGQIRPNRTQRSVLSHYGTDLTAQLWDDMRQPQMYAGMDEFIEMSDGLPRNLLVILKNVCRWAVFNGERPFQGEKISLASQQSGVLAASEWFLDDAMPLGQEGIYVHAAIQRLGDLLRRMRFSDKPVESSLGSFSADLNRCSPEAREVIETATQWNLLMAVDGGQKDRNTKFTDPKFHLNRLLCPRWNLPIGRRGAIALTPDEANAIFDPKGSEQFIETANRRLGRMNVPFEPSEAEIALQTRLELDE